MIIICIIKKLSHNTQHHPPDIVTFISEPSPSPIKSKNLDYKILKKLFSHFSCMIQIIIVNLQQIKYASL